MVEIKNSMETGSACQLCGCLFVDPLCEEADEKYVHGYPAVCWDCWKTLTEKEKKIYQRAEVETL